MKSHKPQGWYMYERVAFLVPDFMQQIVYTCPSCSHRGAKLVQRNQAMYTIKCANCKGVVPKIDEDRE